MKRVTLNISVVLLALTTVAPLRVQAETGGPRPPTLECQPNGPAQQALEQIIRAYERADVNLLQERLAPDLPGLGFVLDALTQRRHSAFQTELRLTERQLQCGPDVAIVDFAWERRSLYGSALQPKLERGRSAFLFSGLGKGVQGPWRLSAVLGDNPFLGAAGAPGRLYAQPAGVSHGVPATMCGFCPAPGNLPTVIEVYDPDLSGPALSIQASASNGDSETLTLSRVGSGHYRLNGLPVTLGGAVIPGNGRIDVPIGSMTVAVTLQYQDTEPGGGARPQTRSFVVNLEP